MLTWLGHAGFKIECTDPTSQTKKVIYIDPWFNSPVCPEQEKASPVADLILVTHGHFDHCSDSPDLSKRTLAPILAIHELSQICSTLGATSVIGMNKGGTYEFDFCSVTMVSADHSTCGPNNDTATSAAGAPVGFVITFKDGTPAVYHAGDTNVFSDMKIISDLYSPKVALLPIGGNYTMGPREAGYAVSRFLESVVTVIPMHYGTFPLLKGTPEELRRELSGFGSSAQMRQMEYGEVMDLATI